MPTLPKPTSLPPYLTVRQVKDILGPEWSMKRTRRWLTKEDCVVKRAGFWVVPRHRLRLAFPELYDEFASQDGGESK